MMYDSKFFIVIKMAVSRLYDYEVHTRCDQKVAGLVRLT